MSVFRYVKKIANASISLESKSLGYYPHWLKSVARNSVLATTKGLLTFGQLHCQLTKETLDFLKPEMVKYIDAIYENFDYVDHVDVENSFKDSKESLNKFKVYLNRKVEYFDHKFIKH